MIRILTLILETWPLEAYLLALLRLSVGMLSAGAAALAIMPAPTYWLWMLAVAVTEWGHVLALLALMPLLPGWRRSWSGRTASVFCVLAAILALTPLLRAVSAARQLPLQLAVAFGEIQPSPDTDMPPRPAPLVGIDLVRGVPSPDISACTLVYASVDGQALQLDLYPPPAPHNPAPGVIVIHGGAWHSGNNKQFISLNRYLAARGYVVAAINYRLAPRWPFPAAREDVKAALSYLKTNAHPLGLDPQRLVLLGRSAGGQLALLVAYTTQDPAIRGVVSLYAPIDLRWGYAHPASPWIVDTRGILEGYLGGSPDQAPTAYDAASPLHFAGPGSPPTLLIHGGRDELVFGIGSERLDKRLAEAGVPHLLLRLPWATHSFDFNFSGPGGQISTYAIEHFLMAVM